jgi:predicted esterase
LSYFIRTGAKTELSKCEDECVRIVLLHGHASSSEQMASIADEFRNSFPGIEVDVPQGSIDVGNGGFAWFDDPASGVISGGPATASAAIALLGKQGDLNGAVVCGFSQGAAMAIAAGFLGVNPQAIVGVCGFLPEGVDVVATSHPLLLVAGDDDEVVDAFYSESLARQVKKAGSEVTLNTVATGHCWTPEITQVVVSWLRKH